MYPNTVLNCLKIVGIVSQVGKQTCFSHCENSIETCWDCLWRRQIRIGDWTMLAACQSWLFISFYSNRTREMKSQENSYSMTFKCQSHSVRKNVFLKNRLDQNHTRMPQYFENSFLKTWMITIGYSQWFSAVFMNKISERMPLYALHPNKSDVLSYAFLLYKYLTAEFVISLLLH